jgi:hypothetical protein
MPHYTNEVKNEVRWLDSVDEETQYLPQGFIRITDAEADTIRTSIQTSYNNTLTYAQKRAAEYPLFADQFDLLYHGGIDAWKAAIQTVKDKYPKS